MMYWEKTMSRGIKGYYRCSCFMCVSQRLEEFNSVNTRILLGGFLISPNPNGFNLKLYLMGVLRYGILGKNCD